MSAAHDHLDNEARRHAEEALMATGDTAGALAMLFQAAAAILISHYPPQTAVAMFESASTVMAEELGALIGVGAVRQ